MKNNWPTKKLGDILKYEQPTAYLVESTEYSDQYTTPVLTAGKSFIKGYTNETDGIFPADKLPVIIFDDFTTATQFVDFEFKVKSTAMKILVPTEELDVMYAYYFMQTISHDHRTHKRYWISEYSKYDIRLPTIDEQKLIVKALEAKLIKVKGAIQLRQDAIADTKKILSAKLNEIFASEKEKEWEEKTLGECVKLQGGNAFKSTDYQDEKGVPLIRIQNLKNEVVDLTKAVYLSYQIFEDSGNFHLESGDILIAMSGATTGKLARIKEGQLPALLNQRVGRFKVNSYAIKNFVYYFLKYKQSHILEIAYGGAQPNISGGKIEALKISLPNLKKQKQLVNELDKLVGQIDELKSLQEEQMKDLKSLERAYLHEAFSGELA
jgi:type I restriction enzyme S subunit